MRKLVSTKLTFALRSRWLAYTMGLLYLHLLTPLAYRNARATWVQTELLNTFSPSGDSEASSDSSSSTISAITIMPRADPATAGRFRVWLYKADSDVNNPILIHDRKIEGGFAEMKVIVSLQSSATRKLHLLIAIASVDRNRKYASILTRTED